MSYGSEIVDTWANTGDPMSPTDPIAYNFSRGRPTYENPGPLGRFSQDPKDKKFFAHYFFSEELCIEFIVDRLYPRGFVCSRCQRTRWYLPNKNRDGKRKKVIICSYCRSETWFLKDTIFHRTKLPLTTWFRAAFLLRFPGTNASNLERMLGVVYNTAWLLSHKLRYAMGILQRAPRCADAV